MEKLPLQHWYDDKQKWHTVILSLEEIDSHEKYREVLDWLQTYVDNPLRHARWCVRDDSIEFRFRYERDYLRFRLSW